MFRILVIPCSGGVSLRRSLFIPFVIYIFRPTTLSRVASGTTFPASSVTMIMRTLSTFSWLFGLPMILFTMARRQHQQPFLARGQLSPTTANSHWIIFDLDHDRIGMMTISRQSGSGRNSRHRRAMQGLLVRSSNEVLVDMTPTTSIAPESTPLSLLDGVKRCR
jgi:hypothetical protein